VARSHHENWDGSGYPDGLRGEVIPLEARIVHLVDVYDALTNVRPYKSAWTAAAARDFVRQQRGLMFDPALVDVFMGAETNSPSRQASES
jgi:putative two-component system response regulator